MWAAVVMMAWAMQRCSGEREFVSAAPATSKRPSPGPASRPSVVPGLPFHLSRWDSGLGFEEDWEVVAIKCHEAVVGFGLESS